MFVSSLFLFKLVKSPVFMSLVCDELSVLSHLNMCGLFFFPEFVLLVKDHNKQLSCTHFEKFSSCFSGPFTSCMNLMMDHGTLDFQTFSHIHKPQIDTADLRLLFNKILFQDLPHFF